MFNDALRRRAKRALDRQLVYQSKKAAMIAGREPQYIAAMIAKSRRVSRRLEQVRCIPAEARVLEVGSGAHGLIFYFEAKVRVGIDPLASHYAKLFPAWQSRVRTVAAEGEHLPFGDDSFDIVLCDNVVDHAENPKAIVKEIARVLVPGGLLYFEVNVHHAVYHVASLLHAGWRALGVAFEITPFADHTVHLTIKAARRLFSALPLRIVDESDDIS